MQAVEQSANRDIGSAVFQLFGGRGKWNDWHHKVRDPKSTQRFHSLFLQVHVEATGVRVRISWFALAFPISYRAKRAFLLLLDSPSALAAGVCCSTMLGQGEQRGLDHINLQWFGQYGIHA